MQLELVLRVLDLFFKLFNFVTLIFFTPCVHFFLSKLVTYFIL